MNSVSMTRVCTPRFGILAPKPVQDFANDLQRKLAAAGLGKQKVWLNAGMYRVSVMPMGTTSPDVIADKVQKALGPDYKRTDNPAPHVRAEFKPLNMKSRNAIPVEVLNDGNIAFPQTVV
jgi:hypothetical protein